MTLKAADISDLNRYKYIAIDGLRPSALCSLNDVRVGWLRGPFDTGEAMSLRCVDHSGDC